MNSNYELVEVRHVQTTTRVFVATRSFESPQYRHFRMPIAFLTVCEELESVELVHVAEEERGQGIATALLEYARGRVDFTLDMADGARTPLGSHWCKARGLKLSGKYQRMAQREVDAMAARMMVTLFDLDYEEAVI